MKEHKFVGFRATGSEVALAEAIRKKTDETTISAVLRKSLKHYAKSKGVPA